MPMKSDHHLLMDLAFIRIRSAIAFSKVSVYEEGWIFTLSIYFLLCLIFSRIFHDAGLPFLRDPCSQVSLRLREEYLILCQSEMAPNILKKPELYDQQVIKGWKSKSLEVVAFNVSSWTLVCWYMFLTYVSL